MTQELFALLVICLLAPIQAVTSGTVNACVAGFSWGLGNRVTEPVFPPWVMRFKRSHANLLENLPTFIGVVLVAHLVGAHDGYTVCAAWAFVGLRVASAVIYTLGITFLYVRTLAYFCSLGAMAVIAWRALTHMSV